MVFSPVDITYHSALILYRQEKRLLNGTITRICGQSLTPVFTIDFHLDITDVEFLWRYAKWAQDVDTR